MRSWLMVVTIALAGSTVTSAQQRATEVVVLNSERPSATGRFRIPTGGRVEPSGFLTVEQAPSSAPPPTAARPRHENERTFYAELAGVSNAEAAKRMREQEALRPTAERLVRQLRTKERGNFTDVEIIHKPDWAYLLYFKREPARTLARYTSNPRFQGRGARYNRAELQKLSQPWIDRFEKERLFTGYGMNARKGTADIDMVVSEEEFAAIAALHRWGAIPEFLNLKFDKAPVGAAVDLSVAAAIRIFAQRDRGLGIINMAGFNGRIVLRDGCFFVDQPGTPGKSFLAYFPREVGLYVDPEGFLALRTRAIEPRHLGRIGESFSWAGPIGIGVDAPMVPELRGACGKSELMHLSVPESHSLFHARYPRVRPNPPPPPPAKRP